MADEIIKAVDSNELDFSKIPEALSKLTGADLIRAELETKRIDQVSPEINFSKTYQAKLAALALGLTYQQVLSLPAAKFTEATLTVSNFLLGGLAREQLAQMAG